MLIGFLSLALASLSYGQAPPDWTVEHIRSPTGQALESVRLTRSATEDVVGWPDDERRRPTLSVECTRGKFAVVIDSQFVPEVGADYYDTAFVLGSLQWDQEKRRPFKFRQGVVRNKLYLQKGKKSVAKLIEHRTLEFGFTPFNGVPTRAQFQLAGLKQALDKQPMTCHL